MIIDFHAHIFPDKIADKTIDALSKISKIKAHTNGTIAGLENSMVSSGVNISVNLPVLTNPNQFESVTRFALEINKNFNENTGKIISFAGIHPNIEGIEGKIRYLKEQGFLGIKIHPDYQETFVDDDNYYKILKCAKDNDLIVVTHAGLDRGYIGQPIKCTPERVLKLLDRLGGYSKFVIAHLGGEELFEETYSNLAGKDIYFDTSFVLNDFGQEKFNKLLTKHGVDKILFATDSPWRAQDAEMKILKSYGLDQEIQNKIFYKNALQLLGLEK